MFCSNCGNQVDDNINFCSKCGFRLKKQNVKSSNSNLLNILSERVRTNAIIWLVIGILQVLGGLFIEWWILIVGVLNIVSSIKDMTYSKEILDKPVGIVKNCESLTGPIITLIYNLVIGGLIGVIGSIYYFVAIRSFVMENKEAFLLMEKEI